MKNVVGEIEQADFRTVVVAQVVKQQTPIQEVWSPYPSTNQATCSFICFLKTDLNESAASGDGGHPIFVEAKNTKKEMLSAQKRF